VISASGVDSSPRKQSPAVVMLPTPPKSESMQQEGFNPP
jgi:hypothetical protein